MSFNSNSKKEWYMNKNPGNLPSIHEETSKKSDSQFFNPSTGVKRGRSLCFPNDNEYVSTKIAIDVNSEQALYKKTTEAHILRRFKSDKVKPTTTSYSPATSPLFGLGRSYTTVDRNNKRSFELKVNRRNSISPDGHSQKLEEITTHESNDKIVGKRDSLEKDTVSLYKNRFSTGNSERTNSSYSYSKQYNDTASTLCEVSPTTKEYKTASYYSSSDSSPRESSDSPSPTRVVSLSRRYSSGESEANYKSSSSDHTRTTSTDSHYSSLYRNHSNKLLQQYGMQYYTALYPRSLLSSSNEASQDNRPTFLSSCSSILSLDEIKDKISIKTAESRSIKITRPYFTFVTTMIMVAYFVVTMVYNYRLSGRPIQISPFNIMVGPNKQTLIYTGARFIPCIKSTPDYPPTEFIYTCPHNKESGGLSKPIYNGQSPLRSRTPFASNSETENSNCNLQNVCGGPAFADTNKPNQGYRFFSTLFMHSGVVQLLINLSLHTLLGISIETRINLLRYGIIWLVSGVFGYIFSANFVPEGNVSVGCSVSLMGVMAFLFIDLIKNWDTFKRPRVVLIQITICFVSSLAIGLLPGYDNFAHLGGFIGGLLSSLVVLPMAASTPLPLNKNNNQRSKGKDQVVHLWLMRIIAFSFIVILIWIMLYLFTFQGGYQQTCKYCQYFFCIPISDICSPYK